MASYFEEHNCEPLRTGEIGPDNFLDIARLLLESGVFADNNFFAGERVPPPASKKFVEQLKTKVVRGECQDKCAICLKIYDEEDEVKTLPCEHEFHSSCILPWLSKTNSCPMCRHEMPTDDPNYEELRKQKEQEKDRKVRLENLHDSMFG